MSTLPAKPKSRLGRGLSSLLSLSDAPIQSDVGAPEPSPLSSPLPSHPHPTSAPPAVSSAPLEIPLAEVVPNPHQPRRSMNESSLAELAGSLKSTGLIQPIIVRKTSEGYELIAGERRFRAAKLVGLAALPAIVRDVDPAAQAQMALIENIQREDLNPVDRAQAYRALLDQLSLTQADLATRLGEDRSSIANFLRLLDLPDEVQSLLRDGQLSVGHAKLLASLPNAADQIRLATKVCTEGISVRNLEKLLQSSTTTPPSQTPSKTSAHLQDLEKTLSRQLGLRAQLKSSNKKGKGRLILHYATLDQFDELLARLGVSPE